MFNQLFAIIAPVFAGALLGYFWAKSGKPFDTEFVTSMVFNIATPLLVFSTLTRLDIDPVLFGEFALITLTVLVILGVLTTALLLVLRLPVRVYLTTVMTPNTGNVGLPLCLLAFGDQGLALGIIVYSVVSLLQFTLGLGLAAGSLSFREVLRIPLWYAVVAAVLVLVSGYQVPAWIANSAQLYGQMVIPLMLITLGASLAKLRVSSLPKSLMLAALRCGMGLGVGLGVAELFGLEGVARGVIVLQSAMPAAIFNYMLALRYDNQPQEVAGVIVASTLLSFATLPFLLLYLL